MPSYFYHLKFELYPSSRPLGEHESGVKSTKGGANEETAWVPPPGSDIFQTRDWPRHQRVRQEDETGTRLDEKEYEYLTGRSRPGMNQAAAAAATASRGAVIDCGSSPGSTTNSSRDTNPDTPAASQASAAQHESPANPLLALGDQRVAVQDYRFGRVRVESVDIVEMDEDGRRPGVRRGKSIMSTADGMSAGLAANDSPVRITRGRFEQLEGKNTEAGWGIVHLYRDGEETPGLAGSTEESHGVSAAAAGALADGDAEKGTAEELEDDCTTLCVPAVPTYLTYNDFLGFAGQKAIEEISHFRMVMTGRSNRYMVLMKFRSSKAAKRWKAEYNGKLFIEMEPETCHVLFVKSITLQTPPSSFPELSPHDPFTPSTHLKPFPPPTHSLVELPTCPVCLERMDDTTGLLTILCQHLFHCACLQKWRGRGCPVCRFPNSPLTLPTQSPYDPGYEPPFGAGDASLCSVCDCTEDLWICLICGKTGCGRYRGGHAKDHWKESAHNFALEIETQHVWDYAEDAWVHRLIREKGDSKLIELPSSRSAFGRMGGGGHGHGEGEMVPIEKLEHIGLEYTHLLTSQLESQRVYFEELVGKAVAKASAASSAAASASHRAEDALSQLRDLQLAHRHLQDDVIATLERDLAREKRRADKSAELARGFGRSLTEEKEVSRGLLQRIDHVNASMAAAAREAAALRAENAELRDENRDLLFSVSAGERIKDLRDEAGAGAGVGAGAGAAPLEVGEIEGGTLSLPAEKKGRGKGRGRK